MQNRTRSCYECGEPSGTRKHCSEKCRALPRNRAMKEATCAKVETQRFKCVVVNCGETLHWAGKGRHPQWCATHKRERMLASQREYAATRVRLAPLAMCTQSDCARPRESRQMCKMHYKRWARANGLGKSPSDRWTDSRKARTRKRHALIRGATLAEAFDHEEVFERDQYQCGICATPVDKTLAYPHPMSASLDHTLPLSLGGTHTRDNAQCAHLVCNLRKGATVPPARAHEAP